MDLNVHFVLGLVIRLLFIAYGYFQDDFSEVKYTDVDYQVFTDAAEYMSKGLSPFQRPTYRYTPLLAFFVLPNVLLHDAFGKVLFSVLDVLTSVLIYRVQSGYGFNKHSCRLSCFLWLYNPLPIVISTRGNAESILTFLTSLCVLLCLRGQRAAGLLGLAYGISVHFKIYPCIYALSLYIALGEQRCSAKRNLSGWARVKRLLFPTRRRASFVLSSFVGFVLPTLSSYYLYGENYLQEALLYHLRRKDTRHNFSPYFYLLYLMEDMPVSLSLFPFLLQAALIAMTSVTLDHLPSAMFVHTLTFVTFNKVVTSQYFMWYLCLFPMTWPFLKDTLKAPVLAWLGTQAAWLLAAYFLEFRGENTFLMVFGASLAFFLANVWLICEFVKRLSCVARVKVAKKIK